MHPMVQCVCVCVCRSDYTRLLLEVKTGERIGKERGLLGSWF